jgi:hypothetical protein
MRTALSGPVILYGNDNPQQISDNEAGPNIDYQSNALLDSRFVSQVTAAGEGSQGGVLAWNNPTELEVMNAIPASASTTIIAAAQAPTIGGFFTLAAANTPGLAVNMPLIPQGAPSGPGAANPQALIPGSVNLVNVLALDFGFALGTTVAGSAVLTLTGPSPGGYTATATYASRFFYPGQKVLVTAAGNAGGTLPLATTVLATDRYAASGQVVQATGTVLLANASLFTGAVQIGTSDQEYGVTCSPVVRAGASRVYDGSQMLSRQVIVTASGASTGTVTVRGYDIYGQPMSELQTIVGTGTSVPKKAFKYISSVQLNTGSTLTGTLSVGTNAAVGLPVRVDLVEPLAIWVNNVQILGVAGSLPAGLVMADQTIVATNATGDVRGTYTMQTAPNGVIRIVIFYQPPLMQSKVSTNIDPRGFVGVTQA